MAYFLPTPQTPVLNVATTAEAWERAAPGYDGPNLDSHEGRVTARYLGPAADPRARDDWMGEDIFVVPRPGVMNGRQLFDMNQWQPPNEGHGEYGFAQDGPFADHSTRLLALFWSDWVGSTAKNYAQPAFDGSHVVISRVPPGSVQGYMPTYMEQYNTKRDMPGPWDAQLYAAREQYLQGMRATTSTPGVNP
jgi:hypothetical protein